MAKRVGSSRNTRFFGQDPKRRSEIEAKLFEDFQPKDVLEEIWLSEIAVLTATIEYYRHLEISINFAYLEKHGVRELLDKEQELATALGKKLDRPGDHFSSPRFRNALGKLNQHELKQINTVIDMINKLRRERERIYNQFERKRRPAVINAVKYQEISPDDDAAIENLAD